MWNLEQVDNPLQSETLDALLTLEHITSLGMTRMILVFHAMELKQALSTTNLDHTVEGSLFKQIMGFMNTYFDHLCVCRCPIECNKVVDCLAMYGASVLSSGSTVFMSQVPDFVTNMVSSDMLGAIDK